MKKDLNLGPKFIHPECAFVIGDLVQIWRISALVTASKHRRPIHQTFYYRLKFFSKAARSLRLILPLLHPPAGTPLERLMRERPETLGAVIWPYLCADWNREERISKIIQHCTAVQHSKLDFSMYELLVVADLSDVVDGLRVIIDQPKWLMREGLLVMNLFIRTERIYSLAFSLARSENGLTAIVGGLQGRNIEGVLDVYREITKGAHGIRPRDLLIEIFRMLCIDIGINEILAISDSSRLHRSSYFGDVKKFAADYDEIWRDRAGKRISPSFFEIQVAQPRKDLNNVPAKKRGMYRKRYLLLDSIYQRVTTGILALSPQLCAGKIDMKAGDDRIPLVSDQTRMVEEGGQTN